LWYNKQIGIFTNELKEYPVWTEEKRKKQSANARKTKPWEHSTGPRTSAGKKASARNSYKHGLRGGILRKTSIFLSRNNKLLKELT